MSSERVLQFVPQAGQPAFYAFGRFRLGVADRQLFRDSEAIPLTPKAAEMLLLLVRSRGAIVRKETMMAELWPDTFVEESNLAQHVFRLRKALDDGYIETVPRRGYRFTADVTEVADAPRVHRAAPVNRMIIAIAVLLAIAVILVFTRHDAPSPVSAKAREAYLKGEHHWNRRTVADFQKAIEYFRIAVEEDPEYADAWAGLAHAYNFTAQAPRAKVAAQRALALDPRSAKAYAALGNVSLFHDFDFAAAEHAFRRATELDPSYATAHQWQAFALVAQKKYDAALVEIDRARALDPSSLIMNTDVGDILYYARRYDDAIYAYRAAIELDPNFAEARGSLAFAYMRKGMFREARAEFDAVRRLTGHVEGFEELEILAGHRQEGLRMLGAHEASANFVSVARVYAVAGDAAHAVAFLERAYAVRDGNLALIHVEPAFDGIRGDPRFIEFLRTRQLAL